MRSKVRKWSEEIKQLASIAQSQPRAAYCAYTHGLSSRWSFLSHTIPNIATLLQPLEDAIQQHLLPALTGHPPCSNEIRDLLALPVRMGGMGLINPVTTSQNANEASVELTSLLVSDIASQDQDKSVDILKLMEIKTSIRQSNRTLLTQRAEIIYNQLSPLLKRQVDLAKEKGASSWLSVLPLDDQPITP